MDHLRFSFIMTAFLIKKLNILSREKRKLELNTMSMDKIDCVRVGLKVHTY